MIPSNKENNGKLPSTTRKTKDSAGTPKTRNRSSSTGVQKEDDTHFHKLGSGGRSSSRDRVVPTYGKVKEKDEPSKKRSGSLPNRIKSNENKGSRGRRENGGNKLAKKKAPIRRTQSYESITTAPKSKNGIRNLASASKERGNRSFSNLDALVAQRGFPMTSVGCAPVAFLRTNSPNNADTDNLAAARPRRRPTLHKRSSSARAFSCSRSRQDCKIPAVEYDRKPTAKRRSKSTKRSLRKDKMAHDLVVPLNPEESLQFQRNFATEATSFAYRLKALLHDFAAVGTSRSMRSSTKDPIFVASLSDEELKELVTSMFQTQAIFRNQRKPHRVDVGYHFCTGKNIKRIQQQPGLWSKLQAKGINRSQDGEGIYTFDNPLPSHGNITAARNGEDVWMAVARLQGNRSSGSRRGETDALVQSENNLVVLKTSKQFYPLVHFRSTLIAGGEASLTRPGRNYQVIINHIQLMQERLQMLLDGVFNTQGISSNETTTLSPNLGEISRRPERDVKGGKETQRTTQPLFFSQQLDAVSNPAAWEVASEIQAVVEEYAGATRAILTEFGKPPFAVRSAVPAEEMAVLADNMFMTQNTFHELSKPAYIEIGYHYCRGQSLRKMQPGFWSNIQSRGFNKSEDGDGIYTFNDPLGTRSRGNRGGFFDVRQSISNDDDVWLLVARLQGNRESPAPSDPTTDRKWNKHVDSLTYRQSDDVVVLRTSAQFFPVVQFPAGMALSGAVQQELQLVHQRLQATFDQFYNQRWGDIDGEVKGEEERNFVRLQKVENEVLDYCAPNTLDVMKSIYGSSQQIYRVLSHNRKATNDDCSICLDSLRWTNHQQVVRLKICGHEFHRTCLHAALQHFDLCPICNQEVTPPAPQSCLQGFSPSGIMVAKTASRAFCHGFWAPGGSLSLSFFIPAGVQKDYHEHPGVGYLTSNWKAFLPYNDQGLRLLRRLQYAFLHGLLFTVKATVQNPTSKGSIVRTNISLKIRPGTCDSADAEDAFPDPAYFERCNQELDRCGVPDSAGCHQFVMRELEAANTGEPLIFTSPAKKPQGTLSLQENRVCARVLKGLQKHQHGWMFCNALPALNGKVERPMDFATIENKLTNNEYSSVERFGEDVNLTLDNAMACHSKENPVHYMAKQLKKKFKKDLPLLQG